MKYVIKDLEIGLLYKNGLFVKSLPKGVYNYLRILNYGVDIADKKRPFGVYLAQSGYDISMFDGDENLKKILRRIAVKDGEAAFHFTDGVFSDILYGGNYYYFNDVNKHDFIFCDAAEIDFPETIPHSVLDSDRFKVFNNGFAAPFTVGNGREGALFCNGKLIRILPEGRYWFCTKNKKVEVKEIDKRIQSMQISGQELLTSDKVELRINFALSYKINDTLKAASEYDKFDEQLYLLFQFALREYVSTKSLDELLVQKHEIGKIILDGLKAKEQDFGVSFIGAGIKDVILPGEVKDILNTVLIAEKKAYANVVTRREETASTRSLLNTAKLMDENKTLYRLKELEYLERICDKVGSISLSNGGGLIEQLSALTGEKSIDGKSAKKG
ncbi:MAG: slipin family protein [Clostridiales bacterium]|nr:slipin family protein [Clostridiales bacterium]